MDSITFRASNAFGIGKLDHTFSLGNKSGGGRCVAIYAPNGVCKSSLRKSITLWSQEKQPEDAFFPDRESSFDLIANPEDCLAKTNIQCFESMGNLDGANFFDDALLASPELKKRYLSIMREHDRQESELIAGIRKELVSGRGAPSTDDVQRMIVEISGESRLPQALRTLLNQAASFTSPEAIEGKTMGKMLGKNTSTLEKPEIKESLVDFAETRRKVLSGSGIFSNTFDYSAAKALIGELAKSGFFEAGHSLALRNSTTGEEQRVSSTDDFERVIQEELNKADNNPEVQEKFRRVDSAFGKSAASNALKRVVCESPSVAAAYADLPALRKSFLLRAFLRCKPAIDAYLGNEDAYKNKMIEITQAVRAEITGWDKAVKLFRARFNVPFEPIIENRANTIIGGDDPVIRFRYAGAAVDNETLFANLSDGERKALYMLSVIFQVEKAKEASGAKLLVFDDVVDSFDYANKYAFIEYLRDFAQDDEIYVILLTHNFDFYRTVASRLSNDFARKNCVQAERSDEGTLTFKDVNFLKRSPMELWRKNLSKDAYKVATIPMVRELSRIRGTEDSDSFSILSAILHGRSEADKTTFDDLSSIYIKCWDCDSLAGDGRLVYSVITSVCDKISESDRQLDLHEKIDLSIGIRILAEHHIADVYDSMGIPMPKGRQLGGIVRDFKEKSPAQYESCSTLLEQACLLVPENIHINSFMYEPLVDIGSSRFINLYRGLKELTGHEIRLI